MKLGLTRHNNAIWQLCLAGLVACGPALQPTTPATQVAPTAPTTQPASSAIAALAENGAEDDDLDSDIAAITASLAQEGPGEMDAPTSLEDVVRAPIVYRVGPQGLTIEVDGLHLRPTVRPIRHKNGSFSLEIALEATSFDGRTYWIRQPKEGPLSIAGVLTTADGHKSRFSDRRHGDITKQLNDSESVVFRQRWPGANQPKLWRGQTLQLEIGLWGTRAEDERERPVRRLFSVEFLAKKGFQPAISPPALDWGT